MFKVDIQEAIASAVLCENENLDQSAISLFWGIIRGQIFLYLDQKQKSYGSTESALLEFMKICDDPEITSRIYKIYHYTILNEFAPASDLAVEAPIFVEYCRRVLGFFGHSVDRLQIQNSKIIGEINEHISDCEWNKQSHFFSAAWLDTKNSWIRMLLLISASISAILGLSSISDLFGHQGGWGVIRNTALQVFGLLTAGLSTLNLSSDLNSRAEKHRSIANKYLSFGRDARHLLVEFRNSGSSSLGDPIVLEKLSNLKNMLNSVAQDAPPIPTWAYHKTKKEFAANAKRA